MKPQYRPPNPTDGQRALEKQLRAILDQFGEADVARLIGPFAIGTTKTRIPHGLTSVPAGWSLVSPDADATVYEAQAPDATYLYLIASVAVNAKLRVF